MKTRIILLGALTLFSAFVSDAVAQDTNPICEKISALKDKAPAGFTDMRGDIIAKGYTPYDGEYVTYTKTRYAVAEKILDSASNCEIWEADDPAQYHNPRYTCHWDATGEANRREIFDTINAAISSCFAADTYECAPYYDKIACYLKGTNTGDVFVEWGENTAKSESSDLFYNLYFNVMQKTKQY